MRNQVRRRDLAFAPIVLLVGGWQFIGGLMMGSASAGQPPDWRYCLGVAADDGEVFVSDVYTSNAGLDAQEKAFSDWLEARNSPAKRTLCPRADNRDAVNRARDEAIRYNVSRGLHAVPVAWRYSP
ncbi:hypothetical protein NK718_02510 [Alsobacter sp. SYSU M60028]|uniref:Uncharacterized protein n=1 Tax=Alsobacter ponti TaxID=2962936 RepID=A0ABT1L7D8_9HYPH|nr:hypothetical protein [Alsobacter ponti]MCP8937375.1 hypothetical protein [Alsobacter ponti]